jgi:hypothetical protein
MLQPLSDVLSKAFTALDGAHAPRFMEPTMRSRTAF